jgi:mRNA deadenylase 3'-5' endonuclease subunit Ccr4
MWNLSWPYRRKILFEELEDIQGDIVCLQEVQADHFEMDVNPYMISLGYDGIYKTKSREHVGYYGKVKDLCSPSLLHTHISFISVYFHRLMVVQLFGRKINF